MSTRSWVVHGKKPTGMSLLLYHVRVATNCDCNNVHCNNVPVNVGISMDHFLKAG
jgi:hypothetical protein